MPRAPDLEFDIGPVLARIEWQRRHSPHSFHVFDDVFGEFGGEDGRVEALLCRAS